MEEFDLHEPCPGLGSTKWGLAMKEGCPADTLPFTVADMAFPTAPVVREAVQEQVSQGVWGYTTPPEELKKVVCDWMKNRNGWSPRPEWIVSTLGVVPAIYAAVKAATAVGEGVLVQPPVYGPFYGAIKDTGRKLVENPLKLNPKDGRYEMDFDDLEIKIRDAKLMLLCSPHNPISRLWSPDELLRVAAICHQNNVALFVDEIWCDLILNQTKFTSTGALLDAMPKDLMIATSAAKSFSLAGIPLSSTFVPDDVMRLRLQDVLDREHHSPNTLFGVTATLAAYRKGEPWLASLLTYLKANADFLTEFISTRLPGVSVTPIEATYVAWLDFSKWNLTSENLYQFLTSKARFYAHRGQWFGSPPSDCFIRINFACPRSVLQAALERVANAAAEEGLIPAIQH
eukprot:Protomagalhaensia_sp_Gyna_25__1587@NODE_1818_length_1502_cov_343_652085_g1493_i0_p1_GENE_NODE_1818_length_1502_cov_343_652085_g1493_i0NODE_1818_length_1502_cov_343_652085_g1493_i0_p1_ORF_typecomplete_len423_score53_31Aminotran_1_2/PF00155_21/8_9e57Cys_Met_Meta_PP/PF01053_20/1_7e05Beta_elim_lyase/PF01212_21/0_0037Aminotran_3/PF00202_21/1_3e03Aminotran_3/PF00202_21/0_24_NODE_1818_length_1502_cov_343_652085_g1493_i0711270